MLKNHTYDKVKVLYKLSALCWFIDKHAAPAAQAANDQECFNSYQQLKKDLTKYIDMLEKSICEEK